MFWRVCKCISNSCIMKFHNHGNFKTAELKIFNLIYFLLQKIWFVVFDYFVSELIKVQ